MRLMVLLLAAITCFGANSLSNRRAPGFSLPDTHFSRYDLQDYRGKWVLIDFMLTNCPHCAELAKTLESVKQKFGARVTILEVVVPPDTQTTVAKYIAEHHVTVPVLFDQGQMAASYFNATPQKPSFDTPHLFVVDPKGQIVRDFGHEDAGIIEGPQLFKELDTLIGKP
jgi:peroxiredoxin